MADTWLFFDVGGTMADESWQELEIIEKLAAAFGCQGLMYTKEHIQKALKEASRQYLPPVKGAIGMLSKTKAQYMAISSQITYNPALVFLSPQVKATLAALGRRYPLGIIANQPIHGQEMLKVLGIHHYFSLFALSGDIGFAKPDPRLFLYALQKSGCSPQQAVMIGDRLDNDIYPANRLGFTTLRLLQGLGKEQLPKSPFYQPRHTLSCFHDLLHFF